MRILIFLVAVALLFSVFTFAAPDQKLFHDIRISSIIITEESLHCNKEVLVLVDIENKGTFTEQVYVELLNAPLGVHAFSPPREVLPRSREQVLMPLYFNEEPQGAYTFDAYLYGGHKIQQTFQAFTFAGCKTVQLTSFIQQQQPVTLHQQSSLQSDEEPLSLLFLGTLFLVLFLLILASTALFRLL